MIAHAPRRAIAARIAAAPSPAARAPRSALSGAISIFMRAAGAFAGGQETAEPWDSRVAATASKQSPLVAPHQAESDVDRRSAQDEEDRRQGRGGAVIAVVD